MSEQTLRLIVGSVLLLHGLGHGGALGALIWIHYRPEDDTGPWTPARSWLLPSLPGSVATYIAGAFWVVAMLGFLAATLSFWGILFPAAFSAIAVASAIVSALGIVLFFGNWPIPNTLAALGVNIAVLVTQLWLHWPR